LQLNFEYDSSKIEHFISSDEPKICKIFHHILDNAIKFTHHGQINLNLDLQPDKIEITISDTGIGISKEMQQKIFDPFRQIETGFVRNFGGTGLGLSIIKAYTELLNGRIFLKSQPNVGTRNKVSIPAVQIKNIEIYSIRTHKSQYMSNRILIVEDEISNFKYLNELLSETKAEILYAPDGKQAIEISRNEKRIDLVLMDIKMPVLDGHSATKVKHSAPICQSLHKQLMHLKLTKRSFSKVVSTIIFANQSNRTFYLLLLINISDDYNPK
jgi:CheY-like chemotaxis protein